MEINKVVASKLKGLRKENDITQIEIAEKLNITQNDIYKYEVGLSELSFEILQKYAQIFHVTHDYLLATEGKKEVNRKLNSKEDTLSFIEYCFSPDSDVYDEIKKYIYAVIDRVMEIRN